VNSRTPLWTATPDDPVIRGLRVDEREVLITRVLDAEPDHLSNFPKPSPWPFWAADRKSTRLNSSHGSISYAVFCLKKKQTSTVPLATRRLSAATYSIRSARMVTLRLVRTVTEPGDWGE